MRLFLAFLLVVLAVPAHGMPKPAVSTPDFTTIDLPQPVLRGLENAVPYAASARESLWPLVRAEAQRLGVPPALADAVAIVETGYTPTSVGTSGEIGMMQVMPTTARMLGFAGDMAGLFDPATNIHYGVSYLARAWAASGGDACRALMKYRAGVGQDGFSPLSIQYCRRAAAWLRGQDAELAENVSSHVPPVANLADSVSINLNGRPFHADLSAMAEIADIPGMQVEQAPAIRSWHISGRGRHIQAVVDAALGEGGDDHVIRVPGAEP